MHRQSESGTKITSWTPPSAAHLSCSATILVLLLALLVRRCVDQDDETRNNRSHSIRDSIRAFEYIITPLVP